MYKLNVEIGKQHSGNKKLHSKLEEQYENVLKDKKSSENNRMYRICDINTIIQFITLIFFQ